ncbi:hypothetical protein [Mastigocladopsis repens]|uniref:hypothetical protein n=1 Tax=Mastigocladopsis repens TaxID=221287 RepID=UPI001E62B77C|nr:hypothetical protein [Mastigocladopsis repens]
MQDVPHLGGAYANAAGVPFGVSRGASHRQRTYPKGDGCQKRAYLLCVWKLSVS